MALRTQISERQRRFGAELRRLREAAGVAVKDAGALVGMGGPQLSHIEAARTGLDPERLAALLAAYGSADETYNALLCEMGASDGRGWWSGYKEKVPGLSLDLAETEHRAVRMDHYETLYIPGLLQVPGYAEAIYRDSYRNEVWDLDTAVRFRMDRQQILRDEARTFRFVIHEAALRMRFPGGAVMQEQLLHLIEMADRPNISIQVFPFDALRQPPNPGSFQLCDPGCADLATVIVDAPSRTDYHGGRDVVATYCDRFDQVREVALPPIDAAAPRRGKSARDSWGILHHLLYLLQS